MSGTRWSTTFTHEISNRVAFLTLNTYYKLGRNMGIYAVDTSGTNGSFGYSVSSSTTVLANKTTIARAKGTYNISLLNTSSTYTIYTEVGFIKAYQFDDGFYVDYFTKSWLS